MSETIEKTAAETTTGPAGVIVGQHCVVRTNRAGVHLGVVASKDGGGSGSGYGSGSG